MEKIKCNGLEKRKDLNKKRIEKQKVIGNALIARVNKGETIELKKGDTKIKVTLSDDFEKFHYLIEKFTIKIHSKYGIENKYYANATDTLKTLGIYGEF